MIVSRGIAILATAVAVVALMGGCGGGSDSGSSTASLSKAQYIKQGDAICAKAEKKKNTDLEAAFEEGSKGNKPLSKAAEQELVTTVALPPIATMTEELAALGEPDTEGEEAAAVVAAFEDGVQTIEDDPAAVLKGSDPFAEADKLAAQLGFKACDEI